MTQAYHRSMNTNSTPVDPEQPDPEADEPSTKREGISSLQLIQSTMAAAFGVQSSKNRQRDFANARPSQFIIAGIVFTALFVGIMVLIVRTILSGS